MNRDKIVKFCHDYLEVGKFMDNCVNGLQVEGAHNISKIITGVSLSKKLIGSAIAKNAEMIIVHHGIFSKHIPDPPQFKGFFKKRLKLLLANEINLCGYHLPLDAHPMIGNNISLIKLLGLKKPKTLKHSHYGEIGYVGEFGKPVDVSDLVKTINLKLQTKCYLVPGGPKKARTVGIIAGSSADELEAVKEAGADTFLTGEIKESAVRASEEAGINFIRAGHYNTEKLGIQNLGNLIAKKFKVKVEFVDIPCEI